MSIEYVAYSVCGLFGLYVCVITYSIYVVTHKDVIMGGEPVRLGNIKGDKGDKGDKGYNIKDN